MSGVEVETWIARSLSGDETAWMRLLGVLWDLVDQRVRFSRHMGQLRSADDRREVVSRVFARLRHNEFRALRMFASWQVQHPDKSFDDWLTIVVTNVIRDYVAERVGDVDASGASLKRLVNTLAESLDTDDERAGSRPPITNKIAATELMITARAILPSDQCLALESWLAGSDFDEIAAEHGLADGGIARAKVRAALARLRRTVRDREAT